MSKRNGTHLPKNIPLRIGIIGGGQLGKMLTLSAKSLGFSVTVIDPTPQSPAGQVADFQIVADYKDAKAIEQLGKISDVITFEIELANDEALEKLIQEGKQVHPSPKTLGIIRDKLRQKQFLKKHDIPTAEFLELPIRHPRSSVIPARFAKASARRAKAGIMDPHFHEDDKERVNDILKAGEKFGYPFLLKARTDAFDGRGNALINNKKDIENGLEKLKNRSLYVEKFVEFKKELAILVARNQKGEIAVYPIVQTLHKDNICDIVLAPAIVSKKIQLKTKNLAKKVMKQLKGSGVFAIELFLDVRNNIFVNEIAPRVHNSGHFTIEGCITSQFEQHIRAITNLPLGKTTMKTKFAVMKNILGEKQGVGFPQGIEKALSLPHVSIHMYSKKESRVKRKMGHITVVGNNLEECLKIANKARKALVI